MIYPMPQDKPADAGLQRHVVVTGWDKKRRLPVLIAEALEAAGIDADVSVARVAPPTRNRDGFEFLHDRSVRKAPPVPATVTVELPRALAETLSKEHPFYLAKEGPSSYDARHAVVDACREALRSSEDSTEPPPKYERPTIPAYPAELRAGVRVVRVTSTYNPPGDGGQGWQYERGATGVVTRVRRGGDIELHVDGDDRFASSPLRFESSWAAGTFKVLSTPVPRLRVGAIVRRVAPNHVHYGENGLPKYNVADGGIGADYEPGLTGTIINIGPKRNYLGTGQIELRVDGGLSRVRWALGSFEVIG